LFASVKPSAATVHWTVAFDGSNLSVLDFSKKKRTPFGVRFFLWLLPNLDISFEVIGFTHVFK